MPANRVALILHGVLAVLIAVGAYIAAAKDTFPKSWENAVLAVTVILGALAAATAGLLKFLDGAQKSEALAASQQQPITGERLKTLVAAAGAPVLTRNEARALAGQPSQPGGDDLITPLNVVTGTSEQSSGFHSPEFGLDEAKALYEATFFGSGYFGPAPDPPTPMMTAQKKLADALELDPAGRERVRDLADVVAEKADIAAENAELLDVPPYTPEAYVQDDQIVSGSEPGSDQVTFTSAETRFPADQSA